MSTFMHYKTFDTHKYIKSLQETGFNEQQAEILVKSLLESRDFDLSILATREQISEVKTEIAQLDSKLSKEISVVKSDLQKDIAEVKSDLQKDIAGIRAEIKQSKIDMLKWIVPIFITILIAIFFKR